jgi:anti-sigma factor RsiW
MCDFSGRLIAWMDSELEANEATVLGQHVRACAECRARVAAYEDVSRGFAAYCDAVLETAMVTKIHRKLARWVPVVAGAAAAAAVVLVLVSLPRSVKPIPVVPRVAEAHPPIAPKTAANTPNPVQRRHAAAHRKTQTANWAVAEPAIQIAIPGDAMFPPGAVPEGVNFVANLSLADGSVQGLRLQP